MEPEELREGKALADVAGALRAMHGGVPIPSTFNSFRVVEDYAATARERGGDIPAPYDGALAQAIEIEAAISGPEHEPVPCHNDLLAANFIWDERRVRIVDWEYAGMGDRYFDLANFAINNGLDQRAAGRRSCVRTSGSRRPRRGSPPCASSPSCPTSARRCGVSSRPSRRTSTSTSPATRPSTSTGWRRPPPTREFSEALEAMRGD